MTNTYVASWQGNVTTARLQEVTNEEYPNVFQVRANASKLTPAELMELLRVANENCKFWAQSYKALDTYFATYTHQDYDYMRAGAQQAREAWIAVLPWGLAA